LLYDKYKAKIPKMISYVEGIIIQKGDTSVVIKAGGLGYRVHASKETINKLPQKGQVSKLYCAHEVKEDSEELYGFITEEELKFYEMLRKVSGVGPKSALAILSLASAKMVASAIASGNVAFLAKVSGVGRKTAEKIILELKDKVAKLEPSALASDEDVDVLEALGALGYSAREANYVLQSLPKDLRGAEARLKEALKFLGKK
jgi:Holliday junction DNA helicase RuvA